MQVAQEWTRTHPDDPVAWTELGHVQLKLHRPDEDIKAAFHRALALAPALPSARHGLARWHVREKRYPDAIATLQPLLPAKGRPLAARAPGLQLLLQLWAHHGNWDAARAACRALLDEAMPATPPAWLSHWEWRTRACWWQPLRGPRLTLRRPQENDAAWLKQHFTQPTFATAVNRDYGRRIQALSETQVAQQLAQQQTLSPVDLGAHLLLIGHTDSGERLGVASFVTLDGEHRRGEFIIGFPGQVPHGHVIMETSLLLTDFVFLQAGLHKVTVSIYGDNPRLPDLQATLERLGFRMEGVLREHIGLPDGRRVDVHLLGGLRQEVLAHPLMIRLGQRYLRPDWPTR